MTVALVVLGVLALVLLMALVRVWRLYADLRADLPRLLKEAQKISVRQSKASRLGKAYEQIVPMLPEFCETLSPADARFLGAPVDYVVFDGLSEGELERVVFVEVKTGPRARLNANERMVREAIEDGRVAFQIINLSVDPHPEEAASTYARASCSVA